jgi:hypothetical protein
MAETISMAKRIVGGIIPFVIGAIMMFFIVYNLGLQYQIVSEARKHLSVMNPTDSDYYFYLHYSNFRGVTIFGSLFFGGIALYLIWKGYHNLKGN